MESRNVLAHVLFCHRRVACRTWPRLLRFLPACCPLLTMSPGTETWSYMEIPIHRLSTYGCGSPHEPHGRRSGQQGECWIFVYILISSSEGFQFLAVSLRLSGRCHPGCSDLGTSRTNIAGLRTSLTGMYSSFLFLTGYFPKDGSQPRIGSWMPTWYLPLGPLAGHTGQPLGSPPGQTRNLTTRDRICFSCFSGHFRDFQATVVRRRETDIYTRVPCGSPHASSLRRQRQHSTDSRLQEKAAGVCHAGSE